MTDRWAWIDEHILHHQILRFVTAMRDRPGPQQASHGSVLRCRALAVVEILAGLLLVLIALVVFLGQGSQTFQQSNYMPVGTFILLLVIGSGMLTLGCWMYARAEWLADRIAARQALPRGSLTYQWPPTSKPSPTSDPEEPPPLPSDFI